MKAKRKMIGKKRQLSSNGSLPKVLIAAPVYEHKYYCIQDYIDNLKELEYDADILLVDNSKDPTAHEIIKDFNKDIEVIYSPFGETTRKSQCDAYNVIRKKFLQGDYDYLMVIECDLIPHESIIKDLMINDVDICGALYKIFGLRGVNDEYEESHDKASKGGIFCVTTGKFKFNGTIYRETFMGLDDVNGETHETQGGCGLGCTLIKRKVLEEIEFRYDICHADTYFHRDSHRKGFKTFVDTRFIIPHYHSAYPDYV